MVLFAELSETITLALKLWNGNTAQYPQAKIYDSSGDLEDTKNLTHVISGIYTNTWSTSTKGYYQVDYIVYSDSARTTKNSDYVEGMETIFVTEAYGGGGAGMKGIAITGRKSPWTYKDKVDIIHNVKETLKVANNIKDTLTDIQNRLGGFIKSHGIGIKDIKSVLIQSKKQLSEVQSKIKDESLVDINNKIEGIKGTLDEFESELSSKNDVNNVICKMNDFFTDTIKVLSEKITEVSDMTLRSLSIEDIGKIEEEINGNGESSSKGNNKKKKTPN